MIGEILWREIAMAGPQPSARLKWVICLWAVSVPFHTRAGASDGTGTSLRGMGGSAMSEAHSGSLLIDYFKAFISDRDLDAFRRHVSRDTTRGPWVGFCQRRTTSPRVAPQYCRSGSWGVSSTVTRYWVKPCATTIPWSATWLKTHYGPSGSVPTRPSTIRRSARCGSRSVAISSSRPRFWSLGSSPALQVCGGIQPAGHYLFRSGPIRRKRPGLPGGPLPQSLSFRRDLRHGAVTGQAQPPSGRPQVTSPWPQDPAAPRDPPRLHSNPRSRARIRRTALSDA